jgi:hypothetical protein
MSERDPRIDPRPGDVLRWVLLDCGDAVVAVFSPGAEGGRPIGCLVSEDGGTASACWSAAEWADWSMVVDGIDGVQVLYRAGASPPTDRL